jgi:hypothetical protein
LERNAGGSFVKKIYSVAPLCSTGFSIEALVAKVLLARAGSFSRILADFPERALK